MRGEGYFTSVYRLPYCLFEKHLIYEHLSSPNALALMASNEYLMRFKTEPLIDLNMDGYDLELH